MDFAIASASIIGVQVDQFILVLSLFIAVPLALAQFYLIKNEFLRHIYSMICGISLLLMQFEPKQLTHFAFISIMVYLMLLALPRNKVALPVLIFSLLCLSSMHIYKIITDYMSWKQDATSPVMLLVCKLSQLAYSYQDGEIIKNTPERIPRESKKLIVDKLPSLFEYLSFILFFPSVSIGPSFEYSDYIRYIKLQDEFKAIPDPFLSSLRVLGYSIIAIGLCVIGDIYFPFTYCTTEEYYQKEFLYKVLFFNIAMVFGRIKFTAA